MNVVSEQEAQKTADDYRDMLDAVAKSLVREPGIVCGLVSLPWPQGRG